jgi:aspartate racemase
MRPARRFGLIGGLGPESTIVYFRLIVDEYRRRLPSGGAPPLLINSIDVGRVLGLVGSGELAALTDYLAGELDILVRAGAAAAAISANTPHIVFAQIQARTNIPLISIVETAADQAHQRGLKRLGLLGTTFTMQARFFPDVFDRYGIELVIPGPDDLLAVDTIYRSELLAGIVRPASRERLVEIVGRMRRELGIEAVILGGTELSLILGETSGIDLPILDTIRIHVAAIVDWMLA